jgi:cell wall-associated NlpC family hydrolase
MNNIELTKNNTINNVINNYERSELSSNGKNMLYFEDDNKTLEPVNKIVEYNHDSKYENTYVVNNYTLTTTNKNQDIIRNALYKALNNKSENINNFNADLYAAIEKANPGTRQAAVTATLTLVAGLFSDYNIRIPYYYGGGHDNKPIKNSGKTKTINKLVTDYYGIDPEWGISLKNGKNDDGIYIDDVDRSYPNYGLDCSSFIMWILHNAGYKIKNSNDADLASLGEAHYIGSDKYIGKPGDLIRHKGHVMFIVGADKSKSIYYVAEAKGADDGVLIDTVPMDSNEHKNSVIDMTKFYSNPKNVTSNFKQQYISNVYVQNATNS